MASVSPESGDEKTYRYVTGRRELICSEGICKGIDSKSDTTTAGRIAAEGIVDNEAVGTVSWPGWVFGREFRRTILHS